MREILGESVWKAPGLYRHTLTTKEMAKVMTVSDGKLLINGVIWIINYKEITNGIFEIWLDPKDASAKERLL